jgi:2,4-dienoyl-CoA reductase-like NADH-dependent reductase (Old Yellow Enzyme family)
VKETRPTRREFIELSVAGAAGATLASSWAARAHAEARTASALFSPGAIGTMKTKNRLVRAATWESAAKDGAPTDAYLTIHRDLAAGGVGTIITGYVAPTPPGMSVQIHIYDDANIEGLKRIADEVHRAAPDCRLVAEVGHGGGTVGPTDTGWPNKGKPRALEVAEIEAIVTGFADGIRRLKEAGFDGAELHGAHAYLLSSFLSDLTNHRTDRYGGSLHKRVQIIREIMDQARARVGDYPIFIKVNCNDAPDPHQSLPQGINPDNFPELAMELEKAGLDAIEVSGNGCMYQDIEDVADESYFLPAAERLTDLKVPVIVTGGNRTVDHLEQVLKTAKVVDFFGLARPLVREPDLPNRWLSGTGDPAPRCISCNLCIEKAIRTGSLRCMQEEALAKREASA